MKCRPAGRGHGERRFAVAGRYAFAHLRLRLRRVEKQDIGALGHECLQPRQRLVETARGARVGTGKQQNALLVARLGSGAAAQDGGVTLDHQLGAAMAERTRPDFVLDQYRGGAATGVSADRLLHGEGVAVARVAIGQPQHIGCGADDGLDRVGHLGKGQEVHVWHREAHRGDAGAGDKPNAKAGFLDQTGAHAVAATRHDLEAGLVEQRLHRGGLWTHGGSFP